MYQYFASRFPMLLLKPSTLNLITTPLRNALCDHPAYCRPCHHATTAGSGELRFLLLLGTIPVLFISIFLLFLLPYPSPLFTQPSFSLEPLIFSSLTCILCFFFFFLPIFSQNLCFVSPSFFSVWCFSVTM